MRTYELVLVLEPSISESERKKLVETITKWLGKGKISETKEWGKKLLARPVKKLSEGFFLLLTLTTEEVVPQDLEKRILNEDKVLRHLLVRNI